jgi:hypothetical protein
MMNDIEQQIRKNAGLLQNVMTSTPEDAAEEAA